MKYLSEFTLLFVAVINCITIIAYCVRETKQQTKKHLISSIIILVSLLVFDIVAGIFFCINGMHGNIAVFALFAPLIGNFFYADIRDLCK